MEPVLRRATAASPPMISRAERAHSRLSWEERLARNARTDGAERITLTLFGLPDRLALFLGLTTTSLFPASSGSVPSLGEAGFSERLVLSFLLDDPSSLRFFSSFSLSSFHFSSFYPPPSLLSEHASLKMDGRISAISLRMSWAEQEGQAVQGLLPVGGSSLLHIDLRGLTSQERERERRRLARQEAHRPFALGQGPLWRTRVLCLGAQDWVLLLTLHHLIIDGWSTPLLLQELGVGYTAACHGVPLAVPPLPIQYADYALWQRAWLHGERVEAELAYWREQLAGLQPLPIPTDHPRPAVQRTHGAREQLYLSAAAHQRLRALSRQEGVTLFMTLLTGWLLVLQHYSGQCDLAVGTPVANRSQAELEGLIGFFVNTLVVRCRVQGEASVRDLLAHVREVTLGAYSHHDVPFERVVEALQPHRELSHSHFSRSCLPGKRRELTHCTGIHSHFRWKSRNWTLPGLI